MITAFRGHVIEGSILVIRVDLAQDLDTSNSGKTCIGDHGGQR